MRLKFLLFVLGIVGFLFFPKGIVFAQCGGCQVTEDCHDEYCPSLGDICQVCVYIDGCNGCHETGCGPCQYEDGNGDCHPLDAACEGGEDYDGGIGRGTCNAPQNVNCPANTACTPEGNKQCNTYNVNYNSSTVAVFDGPDGNIGCQLGNAQALSDNTCNAWFCGYNVTTYACCPSGSVSRWWWVQPPNTTHSVNQCDHESTTNCWPGSFVSWTPQTWCGRSAKDEEGIREDWYIGIKTCRPAPVKAYSCDSICSVTAPNYQNQNYDAVSNSISWTAGNNASSHQLIVSKTEADTHNHCQSGSCTVNLTNLGATASSYNFPLALDPNTRYYVRVIAYENKNCIMPDYGYFDTPVVASEAWWQTVNGSVHANSGGVFSAIPRIGAQAPGVIIRACKKHSLTVFRFLRFSSFFFHSFLPNPPKLTRRTYTLTLSSSTSLKQTCISNGRSSRGCCWSTSFGTRWM